MSGPKLSAWEIEENRRRAEALRVALLAELEECRRTLRFELDRAETHRRAGVAIEHVDFTPAAVSDTDVVSIRSAISSTQQQVDRARRATTSAVVSADRAQGVANLRLGAIGGTAQTAAGINQHAASERRPHIASEVFVAELEAILAQLDPDVATDLDHLLEFSQRGLQESTVDERVLLSQVRDRVTTANRSATLRRGAVEHARRLRLDLVGVAGTDAAEIRRRVDEIIESGAGLDPTLEAQVAEVVDRQQRAEDRAYVADMLRESLLDLGYEVGDSFVTELLGSGASLADRAGWSEHAVEVRLTANDAVLMSVVREGDATAHTTEAHHRRDVEMEQEFCTTVQPVLDGLDGRGIKTGPIRGHEAGANPVRIVTPRTETNRGSRRALQQREATE